MNGSNWSIRLALRCVLAIALASAAMIGLFMPKSMLAQAKTYAPWVLISGQFGGSSDTMGYQAAGASSVPNSSAAGVIYVNGDGNGGGATWR